MPPLATWANREKRTDGADEFENPVALVPGGAFEADGNVDGNV